MCFGSISSGAARVILPGLVVLACLAFEQTALARAEYVPRVQQNFEMGECEPSCSLCHTDPRGGGIRNPWAEADNRGLLASVDASAALFTSDYDGDGFDDRTELTAGSNPGNEANTPDVVAIDPSRSICLSEVPTYGCIGRLARGDETPAVGAWIIWAAASIWAARRLARAVTP
jgi:hypothetical protein